MAKGGEEDARTIWIFFCFFLRSRPAGGDGFGKGSTLGRLEMVRFDSLRRRQVRLTLISSCMSLAAREFLATHRRSVHAPFYPSRKSAAFWV